jgi:hypothetical protein
MSKLVLEKFLSLTLQQIILALMLIYHELHAIWDKFTQRAYSYIGINSKKCFKLMSADQWFSPCTPVSSINKN